MGDLNVFLPYGKEGGFKLEIPYSAKHCVINTPKSSALADFEREVEQALDNPIASPPLKALVSPGDTVAVIINDITRLVKSERYMPVLIEYLNDAGIADADITVVIATGAHRAAAPEEIGALLGQELAERLQVISSRSAAVEDFRYLGTTARGTRVKINQHALEADHIILTGGITFHYLAGFSGGRKSLMPGIAANETICANHGLILDAGSTAGPGCMEGNPVAEDMWEAAAMVNPAFLLNVVLDEDGVPIAVYAGHWQRAHRAGCDFVAQQFGIKLGEKRPLVIASAGGFPKDINLYQAFKGLYTAMQAVKEGGDVVFLARCSEGIGEDEYNRFARQDWPASAKEQMLRSDFSIPRYAGYLNSLWSIQANIYFVSEIADADIESIGMIPAKTFQAALDAAGPRSWDKTRVIPHAGVISLLP